VMSGPDWAGAPLFARFRRSKGTNKLPGCWLPSGAGPVVPSGGLTECDGRRSRDCIPKSPPVAE
jgi:hypothetical protein